MRFVTQQGNGNVVKLKMWEKTMMPESNMVDVGGKKQFVKTGKEIEMTTYTFTDTFGEKLIILSKDNSFRHLEGEEVIIELEVVFNDFQKKNRVTLGRLQKAQAA